MAVKLKYDQIRIDGGTQPRAEMQYPVMDDYAERMRDGVSFPPITVFFDGKDYWLADGFHRIGAALRACPNTPIEAEAIQGTQQDAQWYSFSANKTHGLRRTNEDKSRAIKAALNHPKSKTLSDSAIAEHIGVHRNTVLKIRHEQEAGSTDMHKLCKSESDQPNGEASGGIAAEIAPSRKRTGRDGRTINTAKIGRSPKKSKSKSRQGIVHTPFTPKLGLSKPLRMIPVQFCPENPHTAAVTLIRDFPRSFVEGLVEELTQYLKQEGA